MTRTSIITRIGAAYLMLLYELLLQVSFEWFTRIIGFLALGTCAISIAVFWVHVKVTKRLLLFDSKTFLEPPFFYTVLFF
jgi:hypothetical protein